MARRQVTGLLVLGTLALAACAPRSSAKSAAPTEKHEDKGPSAAANSAVVNAADDVEKGVSPGTRKLNEGADAVDRALKGK